MTVDEARAALFGAIKALVAHAVYHPFINPYDVEARASRAIDALIRTAKAEALEEAADASARGEEFDWPTVVAWLRDRARRIREGA